MANNSSSGGLFADDEVMGACFSYMGGVLLQLDAAYSQYLAVMNGILQNAVMEGETANAVKSFTNCAARLQGSYGALRTQLTTAKNGFAAEVNAADRLSI